MVFQEPASAFNPVYTIGKQVGEAFEIHNRTKADNAFVIDTLKTAGLDNAERIYKAYPHEVSGGQLQRAAIAMAIINHPDILIADEITTALDNLTQKEIINLLRKLKSEMGLSILIISHDLALLGEISDEIAIFKNGELVEKNAASAILKNPESEYTQKLIRASLPESRSGSETESTETLLELENLKVNYESGKSFFSQKSTILNAVKDVSFSLRKGESLGLIGESGSGKSSIAAAILCLIDKPGGDIRFKGTSLSKMNKEEVRNLRSRIQVIFQNPDASLDPRIRIGSALEESLRQFQKVEDIKEKVISLLEMVNLSPEYYDRLPDELSGGEKQRVCIARALSYEPEILICDEAVSSLDAPIKKEILTLLRGLKHKPGLSLLFISHDLGIVSQLCERIIVLKDGRIVEEGPANEICREPKENYTKSLLNSSIRLTKRV
jgi:peptide/nickel transport system ATP-binding protein